MRARPGQVLAAQRLVVELGGSVAAALPIIEGFAGTIPDAALATLQASAAVLSVTPDAAVVPNSASHGDRRDDAVSPLGYRVDDTGSLHAIARITGADRLWEAGFTGQGVDVAVIDTGVARVPGLDRPGKVLDGPDLSFDSVEPTLVSNDAFGHGTHMASIIAGSDVAPGTSWRRCRTCTGRSAYTDTTKFVGIAPDARIINVKVGAHDGAVDVSQVIAAIDWVVQHRDDPGIDIRVLNLSFGTDSVQDPSLDPLVYAAEQAWKAGIVVVASSGNDGVAASGLAVPAASPAIIAVGASDPRGTIRTSDDSIPDFAQHGNAGRGVDVVAPGVSVIGLAVPGGFIDTQVGTGKVGDRFQRASGTSQATAVVSGLVALVISRHPTATPDMVKAYLTGSAEHVRYRWDRGSRRHRVSPDRWDAGAGSAHVGGRTKMTPVPSVVPAGTGLGSLEAARGSYHVTDGTTELVGEIDIFGAPWDPAAWTVLSATGTAWTGGVWNGTVWSGDGWGADGWIDVPWTGTDWTGSPWDGGRWKDAIWDGGRWKNTVWDGGRWKSTVWEGGRWKGVIWASAVWE
ncbi:MAG: S8 family serine peptidase [Ilumatobacteraceae bacterium]